ncbi:DUF2614 family zinc ribbon-containing protein [Paenibacillus sp. VCA1]|uniref:DUF2614 family zinc ribbon-containing protein n=1 Tax=Paenibacillus sp. VCA1 TaxID=3039148 RepID=UPI0037C7647B
MVFLLLIIILAVPIAFIYVTIQQLRAEKVDCPVCGRNFRLMNGSHKCPKCRSRVTRTSDGRLIHT